MKSNMKNKFSLHVLTPPDTETITQKNLLSSISAISSQVALVLGIDNKSNSIKLLSTTNVSFAVNADTTIYTVPSNKRCVLLHAIVVAGSDAGATTTVSIGADGAETNFIPANTMSNLDALNDTVIIHPIPNTVPVKSKSYAGGTVIQAQVGLQSGGVTNTMYLFGFLY